MDELAYKIGIFTPDGLSNKSAILALIKEFKSRKEMFDFDLVVFSNNQEGHRIKVSSEFVEIINNKLIEQGYPKVINHINLNRATIRTEVRYR